MHMHPKPQLAADPHTSRMSAAALWGSLCRLALTHQLPNAAAISSRRPTTGTGRLDHSSAAVSAEYIRAEGVAAAAALLLPGAAARVTTARRACAVVVLHDCAVCLPSALVLVLLGLCDSTQGRGPLCGSSVVECGCNMRPCLLPWAQVCEAGTPAVLLLLLLVKGLFVQVGSMPHIMHLLWSTQYPIDHTEERGNAARCFVVVTFVSLSRNLAMQKRMRAMFLRPACHQQV